MRHVHFIIPDPTGFPSGGNIYNRELIKALINAGVHTSHRPFNPEITPASRNTTYLLDSLYFEQVTDPAEHIPPGSLGLVHHLNSLYPLSHAYFVQHEQTLLHHFTLLIATSRFTADYLVEKGFERSRIIVIEPASMFTKRRQGVNMQHVHALMLGSCIPRKGILPFLETLAEATIADHFTLTIAGSLDADRAYADRCAHVIAGSDSLRTRVHLIGEQEHAAIEALYAQSNLFLSASAMETFGMAIQDAVAFGLAVLALEGGYAAEHVQHGVNGYRCPTMQDLVGHLKTCVEDSTGFQALQTRALQYIPATWTWDDAAAKLIAALETQS